MLLHKQLIKITSFRHINAYRRYRLRGLEKRYHRAKIVSLYAKRWHSWFWRRFLQPEIQMPVWFQTQTSTWLHLTDPVDDAIALELLQRHSIYFPQEFELPTDTVILDIGAHSGLWTAEALNVWPNTRAIAVEPNSNVIANLRLQLKHNKLTERCRIVQGAIAMTSDSTVRLYQATSGSWGNSLFVKDNLPYTDVPAFRLTDILKNDRPILVKCNAEGAEFVLIPQLLQQPTLPQYLLLAVHPEYGNVEYIISAIAKAGYKIKVVSQSEKRPFYQCVR